MSKSRTTKPHNHQPMPNAKAVVVEGVKDDAVTALAALYQGEKTDASYVLNTAMAMMGSAVVYLVAAIPFVKTLSEGPIPWLFVLLLPLPLWLISAFHSLMTLNAMSHGLSIKIIEDKLFKSSGLPTNFRKMVGSAAGDKIMDIKQAKKVIHKLVTVVVYSGVVFLVIGFTIYALYSANLIVKNDAGLVNARFIWIVRVIWIVWTAIATYSFFFIMVCVSWWTGLKMLAQNHKIYEIYNLSYALAQSDRVRPETQRTIW